MCLQPKSGKPEHQVEELPQYLSLTQDCPFALTEGAWVHSFSDWLRMKFNEGQRGKADMIGEHGHKT
jgi:hypothetical protein